MANATETKHAAVWNPPRIRKLSLLGIKSGTKTFPPVWEGGTAGGAPQCTQNYRTPTSTEPVDPGFLSPSVCVSPS